MLQQMASWQHNRCAFQLLQAEEEAVRARETPVSAAVVAAGSSWKAQLQVGSVLFDLGTWHTDEGRERAEKVLSK